MHNTRKMHRAMMRAADADNVQLMRQVQHSLYDPSSSALTRLTSGPSPQSLVPVVDSALLAAYKGREVAHELSDNLRAVGHSFGLSSSDTAHLHSAIDAAATARDEPAALSRMSAHLEAAGYGADCGLCFPDGAYKLAQ